MATPFAESAQGVRRLHAAVVELEQSTRLLQLPPLDGREWYELLTRKLMPQLVGDPYIVAAVVGGTNIGKSVVFNHLAGCDASATSPLASGTKHPTCLVPKGFSQRHDLSAIFQGFVVKEWTEAAAPLQEVAEHRLFWRMIPELPENLLVLDTPDIDSDAEVNWHRADCIRHCADVLIAVLTQQKYNDAAVKQFFRKAAVEGKAVIVVFNQCQLPDDEQYWPLWLDTFCRETEIQPECVYLAPHDREAAENGRLPFFIREFPVPDEPSADLGDARDLSAELSQLRFDDIKYHTLQTSLSRLLDPQQGVPGYLDEVRLKSLDFQSAAELFSSNQLARIDDWPPVPNSLLVYHVRDWWREQREGFPRAVHNFYNTVGRGVVAPFRWARNHIAGEPTDPLEEYRRREWNTIVEAISRLYDGLTQLSQFGNALLQPRLEKVLAGKSREALLETLSTEYKALDLAEEMSQLVAAQMHTFRDDSPQMYAFLKRLDTVAAAARPMTSVVFFFAGGLPVGQAVSPLMGDAMTQAAVHIVGDIAGGTGAVVVGEAAVSGTSEGLRYLESKFRQLQAGFTARRVTWFSELLRAHLLGSLQEELQSAADLPHSDLFASVQAIIEDLRRQPVDVRG
ncbi:hypothetical protein Mal52_27310 [Symmachiella dynata]|uniref:G domain-containing protein n=1 Tax=Symmachiella dynata TaxID=2527995 RepID=A0A517ZP43_9PLAN|nr:GTPase domain-containing protein [Symmachiella dynata]QDU44252.1 hypothetical protein Mal52_27310 [Symmachiella dynata]